MPILKTARYQLNPGSVEKCQQAIREFVEYIKANEQGTLRYTALQQSDDSTRFLHFMMFQDEAAETKHAGSEGVKRFTDVLYPETLAPVEFTSYEIVAST